MPRCMACWSSASGTCAGEPRPCVPETTTPLLSGDVWAAALDPSLPAGVISFQDRDGRWWRYPLAEFSTGSGQGWNADV